MCIPSTMHQESQHHGKNESHSQLHLKVLFACSRLALPMKCERCILCSSAQIYSNVLKFIHLHQWCKRRVCTGEAHGHADENQQNAPVWMVKQPCFSRRAETHRSHGCNWCSCTMPRYLGNDGKVPGRVFAYAHLGACIRV
jgi:hypothetical protein